MRRACRKQTAGGDPEQGQKMATLVSSLLPPLCYGSAELRMPESADAREAQDQSYGSCHVNIGPRVPEYPLAATEARLWLHLETVSLAWFSYHWLSDLKQTVQHLRSSFPCYLRSRNSGRFQNITDALPGPGSGKCPYPVSCYSCLSVVTLSLL